MDYDQVLEHVGQFGAWQMLVFTLASLASMSEAFMTLQYTFVSYMDYKYFRCFIPTCDRDPDHDEFNADYVTFATPFNDTDDEIKACFRYKAINEGPTGLCEAINFDEDEAEACTKHIYDPGMPYRFSIVQEWDIPACNEMDDGWPLKVCRNTISREKKYSLLFFSRP